MQPFIENFNDPNLPLWNVHQDPNEGEIFVENNILVMQRSTAVQSNLANDKTVLLSKDALPIKEGSFFVAHFRHNGVTWPKAMITLQDQDGELATGRPRQGVYIANNNGRISVYEVGTGTVEGQVFAPDVGITKGDWYTAFARFLKSPEGKLQLHAWLIGPGTMGIVKIGNNSRDILTESPYTEAWVRLEVNTPKNCRFEMRSIAVHS